VIYRLSYVGNGGRGQPQTISGESMLRQVQAGAKSDLAINVPETAAKASLSVSSTAFGQGEAIPQLYSSYDQNASPPLSWTGVPQGVRSYAILAEDPDASITPLPVVHWIVWNIPAAISQLREGLQSVDRLEDPMGLRQGPNSAAGSVGYKGLRPPQGDPPHHYHFEIFALDQMLDLGAGADRQALVKAMRGHVLAKGELVGVFKRPEHPVKQTRASSETVMQSTRSIWSGQSKRAVLKSLAGASFASLSGVAAQDLPCQSESHAGEPATGFLDWLTMASIT
jgi:Raf kinase inhibitor-like YbhB/YbcL family protein